MKKLWLELDISGTLGEDAWLDLEQPKGFIEGTVVKESSRPGCEHPIEQPHPEGEWREVRVLVEDLHVESAALFYKEKDRILSVETES